MQESKVPISILICVQNEELNISDCLASVVAWGGQILVLDSGSTDRTLEICRTYGAETYYHGPYEGCAKQSNWAFDHLPFRYPWIFQLCADERLPPALAEEIAALVLRDGDGKAGFWVRLRFIFYGKWIRHSGWYPNWSIRLFKHGRARYESRAIGPRVILDGDSGRLENDIIHEDRKDLTYWIAKHNRYAGWEAHEHVALTSGQRTAAFLRSGPFSVRTRRWVKDAIWPHLPGRALLFFVYLYFFRFGFLDGVHGLRFCILHAIFEYFNEIKQWELQHYKAGASPGGISAPRYFDPYVVYNVQHPVLVADSKCHNDGNIV